jgi:uncharacterized membrane protein YdjX (TVP38/TMEM64 family)
VTEKADGAARKTDWLRVIVPVVLYIAIALAGWKLGFFKQATVQKYLKASGFAGVSWIAIAFIAAYAAVATLALPVGPLAYGAGAIFGFLRGSIYVWIGSMIGATAGYFLARTALASSARRLLGRYRDKLHDIGKGNVFLKSFRMQLLPIVPFGAFNYAAAISRFPPLPFLAGTALGIIPGTLLATFVGDRLIAGMTGNSRKPLFLAIGIAAALMALSFLPALLKKMKKRS